MTDSKRILLRALFGEGLCTFILLFVVEATIVNNGRQTQPENLVLGCISTAFVVIALTYSFADVSGAHCNPAVTFAAIVTQKTTIRKGLSYILIQLIASTCSTFALTLVFPKPTSNDGHESIPHYVIVDIHPDVKYGQAFCMEIILTFILVYVGFASAFDTVDTKNEITMDDNGSPVISRENKRIGKNLTIYTTSGLTKAGFAPIAIGFTAGFLGLLGKSVSGAAYNPARVFGPALITGYWRNHELYWVADFFGAALAGFTQYLFSHEAQQSSADTRM